jgi:hypothetical protein
MWQKRRTKISTERVVSNLKKPRRMKIALTELRRKRNKYFNP